MLQWVANKLYLWRTDLSWRYWRKRSYRRGIDFQRWEGARRNAEESLGQCSPEDLELALSENQRFITSRGEQGRQLCIQNCYLGPIDLSGRIIGDVDLAGCHLSGANMRACTMVQAKLAGSWLMEATLANAWMDSADLTGARLGGVVATNAEMKRADLTDANFTQAVMARCVLRGSMLQGTCLALADLTDADLREATLNGVDVRDARLVGTRGLWGPGRAKIGHIDGDEFAIYNRQLDLVGWTWLRGIGSLRLFGVSYAAFVAIIAYAGFVQWSGGKVADLHEWARGVLEREPGARFAEMALRVPTPAVPPQFGNQLIAIIALAAGATIYAARCPEPIQEASETRWTRELQQPLIEYRAANYGRPIWRYVAFAGYAVGGGYTLWWLGWRAADVLRFLFEL